MTKGIGNDNKISILSERAEGRIPIKYDALSNGVQGFAYFSGIFLCDWFVK